MNPTTRRSLTGLRQKTSGILYSLDEWCYDGEASRTALHRIGADLQSVRIALAGMRKDAQFPSFTQSAGGEMVRDGQERIQKRRELIMMVHKLPGANVEILEWLAGGHDREAAYLYAYARGSASEASSSVKTEFYQKVEELVDKDPVLFPFKGVESLLFRAQKQYSSCQAAAYEKMD